MKKYKTIAYFIFLCLLISGCPMVDWKEMNFTRTKPETKDIVGTWSPTADTLKDIQQRGNYPAAKHELILKADGTFSMLNMPDWWRDDFGKSNKKLESGNGKWQLTKSKNIVDIWTIELEFPTEFSSVNLYGQKTPYLIFIRVGDPNNGFAMFYQRINEKQ
jgi:hypothetical protein